MYAFIETRLFTRLVDEYLSDEEYSALQWALVAGFGRRLMSKAKRNMGAEILEGIREIKRGEHGRVTKIPAVADVRERTGLSQSQFAKLLGVSVRTLQEWEQGRRAPSGAARTLILVAAIQKATQLTSLALDLAAAKSLSVGQASNILSKAYNGQTRQLFALYPNLKKSTDLFGDLAKATKDAAKTAADADPFQRLNVTMGESAIVPA